MYCQVASSSSLGTRPALVHHALLQVDFDEGTALALCDRNGFISRENFFEFSVNSRLVEFTEKRGGERGGEASPSPERRRQRRSSQQQVAVRARL